MKYNLNKSLLIDTFKENLKSNTMIINFFVIYSKEQADIPTAQNDTNQIRKDVWLYWMSKEILRIVWYWYSVSNSCINS